MTISMGPGSESVDEEAPAVVAVGRTIGGILLVLVGIALALVGAFVYFIVPFIAVVNDDDSIWWRLSDLDFVFAIIGGIGLVLAFVGGGLVQRARKRKLAMFVDDGPMLGTIDLSGGDTPPTIK
ncbi:hypothetical protein [Pseudolysinimonas sp.]|uniref:hypothetical protein n=1 Tax=Pseudolysinimonas sp. TaxID=2680009 RepID=UPI00286B670B|nr:hypothetical protein [Pseudolysinimonas sp.]